MSREPYYADDAVTIHAGDCLDVLREMPAASIDAVVTDPPYDLTANKRGGSGAASVNLDSPYGRARIGTGNGAGGFMGKAWDGTGVAFDPATWAEVARVLKPGGFLLAFGGSRTWHRLAAAVEDAGFEIRDSIAWLYGSGFPKSLNVGDGRGTALKPAFEPIVVGRKPLVGTVAANVLAHGTGALNIDACRTATTDSLGGGQTSGSVKFTHEGWNRPWMDDPEVVARVAADARAAVAHAEELGRWPANVLLDESQAEDLDRQSGILTSGLMRAGITPKGERNTYGQDAASGYVRAADTYAASGGASRFFPTFRYEAKAPQVERPRADDGTAHPTVKPLDLMRWLVRLVTPRGGVVLDPFLGSGTTAEACVIEGFRCIGIEREPAYLPLSVARLSKPIATTLDFGESA